MKTLKVKTTEEFTRLVENSDFRIAEAVVEGALKNLYGTKRFIHILTVEIEEDDEVYDLTLDRREILKSLKRNLKHYETEELYEKCREIVNAINYLEKQQNGKEDNNNRKEKGEKEERNSLEK